MNFSDSDVEETQNEDLRVHHLREHLNKVQNKDLRERLDKVLPELTDSNAKDLAAEIARGGNITIPEKQMEENIMRKLKEIRRQNDINKAKHIQETVRDNKRRESRDKSSSRHRRDAIKEDVKNNMRRRAGEEVNRAYERHRDLEYKPTRKSVISESLRSRLGRKTNTDSRAQKHTPDTKPPVMSRLVGTIHEEEYEDVEEISKSESDETDSHRSPPRGSQ